MIAKAIEQQRKGRMRRMLQGRVSRALFRAFAIAAIALSVACASSAQQAPHQPGDPDAGPYAPAQETSAAAGPLTPESYRHHLPSVVIVGGAESSVCKFLSARSRGLLAAPQVTEPQKQTQQGQPQTPPVDEHKYDAYNAEKDIEVGTFYMHKGDIDAAIPRFEDAAKLRPDYGKPRLLLAEAYEKKHDPASAVKYYKEYLKVYRNAPDAKKIQKRIEKLEGR